MEREQTIVLLDAGNSRVKSARLQRGLLSNVVTTEYRSGNRAQDAVAASESSDMPQRIVVSSVLGDRFEADFTRLAELRFGIKAEFVKSIKAAYGIRVGYANPKTFGADRFCALVAARRGHPQSCILVDCGTAVTIDALAGDGQHLGGLIIPGLDLMRRSLLEHTARLTVGLKSNDSRLFGCTTTEGVRVGTLRGLTAAIDQIVGDMSACMVANSGGTPVSRIISGGAGAYLLPRLAATYELDPWLVLRGLAVISEA
jgi:type III pantothenate kinase